MSLGIKVLAISAQSDFLDRLRSIEVNLLEFLLKGEVCMIFSADFMLVDRHLPTGLSHRLYSSLLSFTDFAELYRFCSPLGIYLSF